MGITSGRFFFFLINQSNIKSGNVLLLNHLQALPLLPSKDNSYQGNRIQRHGLGERDREDTLSFGSGRAKMTVVVAQGVVGRCPGNEVVWRLGSS